MTGKPALDDSFNGMPERSKMGNLGEGEQVCLIILFIELSLDSKGNEFNFRRILIRCVIETVALLVNQLYNLFSVFVKPRGLPKIVRIFGILLCCYILTRLEQVIFIVFL